MSLKGLEPDTDYALPVKFGDKIIATAKRIDRQTIQYTFTKDIEEMKYARVYIINSAQENKDVVQNSGNQTFKINVGEKQKPRKILMLILVNYTMLKLVRMLMVRVNLQNLTLRLVSLLKYFI